jgi:Putative transposase
MSHGGNKPNFEMFSPLEFIAAITQHIPERLAQMARYYGWYSNRMRGDRQRAELLQGELEKADEQTSEVIVLSNFRTKKSRPWFGVNVLKSLGGRSASLQPLWWRAGAANPDHALS